MGLVACNPLSGVCGSVSFVRSTRAAALCYCMFSIRLCVMPPHPPPRSF